MRVFSGETLACLHILMATQSINSENSTSKTISSKYPAKPLPTGANKAPEIMMTTAGNQAISLLSRCITPNSALTATAPSAMPVDSTMGNSSTADNSGTANREPPAPVSPSTNPISKPTTTAITDELLRSIPWHGGNNSGHQTNTGNAGKHQTRARKSRYSVTGRMNKRTKNASQ